MGSNRQKLYSFNGALFKMTGVHKVLLDIHHAVGSDFEAYISGTIPYEQIHKDMGITPAEYKRFRNPFMFYNSIVIVHERKYLWMFWLLNHLLFQRIRIVYIHHNIFSNLRRLSIMPKTVVSISDRCTENLTGYFKVPLSHIHKIHNCVADIHPPQHKTPDTDSLTILYPARINDVKRQPEIVSQLKGRLNNNICILFAGDGPLLEELVSATAGSRQFIAMGYISDIPSLMQKCDYTLLFSRHEGLPITLIESAMCGLPIICNDVGGNTEIAIHGKNAIVVNDWDRLVTTLNSLQKINCDQYKAMSAASRQIYEQNYTFEEFKQSYLQLLKGLN
jgi:glycosyltransferase involved in cell wall biosynthesis